MDGLEADNRRSITVFFLREAMKNEGNEEDLSTAQKNIEKRGQENTTPNESTEGKRNNEHSEKCCYVKKQPQGVQQKSKGRVLRR